MNGALPQIDYRSRKRQPLPPNTTVDDLLDLYGKEKAGTSMAKTIKSAGDLWIRRAFAGKRVVDMDREDVWGWIDALVNDEVSPKTGEPLANKTVRKIWGVLCRALQMAVQRGLIAANPASEPENLPPDTTRSDYQPGQNLLTLPETIKLITDREIPIYRRLLWALEAFGGLRHGEAMVLRYGDLDMSTTPLWRMTVARTWGGWPLHERPSTKTGQVRLVPVHSGILQPLILEMREAFRETFGREPRETGTPADTDLLVAYPEDQFGGLVRTSIHYPMTTSNTHWSEALIKHRLSLESDTSNERPQHWNRHFFVTTLMRAGVDPITRTVLTHKPKRGDAYELYCHTHWSQLCDAVMSIRATLQMDLF